MQRPHEAHGIQETLTLLPPSEHLLQHVAGWKSADEYDYWAAIELTTEADIDQLLELIRWDPFVRRCPLFRQAYTIFVPSLASDHICNELIGKMLSGFNNRGYCKTWVWLLEHMSPQLQAELGRPGAKITKGLYCCLVKRGGKKVKYWSKRFAPITNVLAAIERLKTKARKTKGELTQSF